MQKNSCCFTFVLPKFLKVGGKPFNKYTHADQIEILGAPLQKIISDEYLLQFDKFFESHQDGRLHVHGIIFQCSDEKGMDIAKKVCACFGIKKEKQIGELFFISKTYRLLDHTQIGWNGYMKKQNITTKDLDEDLKEIEEANCPALPLFIQESLYNDYYDNFLNLI